MKKENLATLIIVAGALALSIIATSCSRVEHKPRYNTAIIKTTLVDKMRIENEGEVYVFVYEKRRYTMYQAYGSKAPVVLHIQDVKEQYLEGVLPAEER